MLFSVLWTLFIGADSRIALAKTPLDRIESVVNRSLILTSDINRFRKTMRLRSQLDPLFNSHPLSKKGANASRAEIIDFLDDEKIIEAQFPVTDAEIEQEINSIQGNNHIDRKTLRSTLAEQGFSFEEYFGLIGTSLSKRNLIDRDIRTKVFISDDDIKNYFFQNYLKKGVTTYSYAIHLIRSTSRDKIKTVQERLRAGETFQKLSAEFDGNSDYLFSDLGYLSENEMSSTIKDQAKKMKIGEVSGVVPAEKSFMVFKLEDIRTGQEDRLKQVRQEIQNILMSQEFQHQIQLWIERQRQNVYLYTVKS